MVTRLERRVCPHAVSGKMFWLCAITYIIALFGRMSYSAVMVALIANGSMDEAQAGLIGTALFVVYGVSQIFSGLIGDRISPKKMIFVGLIGSGILNLIMGLTGQYTVMLVVWALNGLFQSTMWSPIARIFAEQMPPDERKKCCNNIAVTYPLATILAYVLATVLLTVWNWRGVFLLAGGMIIITGINWMIRMSWFEKQIETSEEIEVIELQPKQTQKKENMLRLLLLSGIVLATVPDMTHGMLRDGIKTWLPTLMTQNFHFGTSASVALDIIIPVFNMLGVFFTKALPKKWTENELKASAAFFAVTIVSLLALDWVCNVSAVLSLILLTVASTCMTGANIMLINLIPVHFGVVGRASSVTGVLNCSAYVGSAISSFGVGAVAQNFGWGAAIFVWIGFSLLALLASLVSCGRWGAYEHRLDNREKIKS